MMKGSFSKRLKSPAGDMALDVSLNLEKGSFTGLFGKSGAGKTTLLRILAGLTKPDNGTISFGNVDWFTAADKVDLPPQKRKVGFVFQDFALFPHLSVKDNILFGHPKGTNPKLISELVEVMELGDLTHQKPRHLSGGQQQRVAIARSLASMPNLLLLDEPFSALDTQMKESLQDYIREFHEQYGTTSLMVSHEEGSIAKMCSEVLVLDAGKVVKKGKPTDVFEARVSQDSWKGKVVAIERDGENIWVEILIGQETIKVKHHGAQEELAVDDDVLLSGGEHGFVLTKNKN